MSKRTDHGYKNQPNTMENMFDPGPANTAVAGES